MVMTNLNFANPMAETLRSHVEVLARAPRWPGTQHHEFCRSYIRSHLEEEGILVHEQRFDASGQLGINLLSAPLGIQATGPLLIVGAHYDSKQHTPGADDNASAVAALLVLAKMVQAILKTGPKSTCQVLFAAYDLEEWGMLGGAAHCESLKRRKADLMGMISLEMLGYVDHRPNSQHLPTHVAHLYPNVGDFIGICGNERSRWLAESVTSSMKEVAGLPVQSLIVPGNGEVLPEVRLSDHSPFWDSCYPALMITDTSFYRNPHYHQSTDKPDTLDFDFLARVTQGVCRAVLQIAGVG